jgi:hypothetical protein
MSVQDQAFFAPNDFLYLILPDEELDRPLFDRLDLPPYYHQRVMNRFSRGGVWTYRILLTYSVKELSRSLDRFGLPLAQAVDAGLRAQGLHLSEHDTKSLAPPPGDVWVKLPRRRILYSQWRSVRVLDLDPAPPQRGDEILYVLTRHLGIVTVGHLLSLTTGQIASLDWSVLFDSQLTPAAIIDHLQAILAPYNFFLVD